MNQENKMFTIDIDFCNWPTARQYLQLVRKIARYFQYRWEVVFSTFPAFWCCYGIIGIGHDNLFPNAIVH